MKHILIAVDGSAYSLAAVKAAAELAAEHDIKSVTLINVIPLETSTEGAIDIAAIPGDIEDWEIFEQPKAILEKTGVKPELLLREGDPADQIVHVAREQGFDLIVVGHRGLSPVKAFLLGSVSDRVVTHAPCSVLVVRPGPENNQ